MIVSDYIAKFEAEHRVRFPMDNVLRRRLRNLCREAKENMAGMKAEQKIDVHSFARFYLNNEYSRWRLA